MPNPESALNEEAGKLLLEKYVDWWFALVDRFLTAFAHFSLRRYEDFAARARIMTGIHAKKKSDGAPRCSSCSARRLRGAPAHLPFCSLNRYRPPPSLSVARAKCPCVHAGEVKEAKDVTLPSDEPGSVSTSSSGSDASSSSSSTDCGASATTAGALAAAAASPAAAAAAAKLMLALAVAAGAGAQQQKPKAAASAAGAAVKKNLKRL